MNSSHSSRLRGCFPETDGLDRWLITGGRVALGPHSASRLDIHIENGFIHSLQPSQPKPFSKITNEAPPILNLEGMLILPGLINAHDHLEFALFPRLGRGVYANAKDWALDIYHPDRSPIRELLQIPKPTRLFWGGLKNLLSGVTTVCHHNHYQPEVFENRFPVRVLKDFGWTHSLDFGQNVIDNFKKTPKGAPFFIHLAEGTDTKSRDEIYQLEQMGLLTSQTVTIHGVAFSSSEWELVKTRGSRLVWCPSSNLFTLGKTLEASISQKGINVALGNDSPVTAAGDLLDEIACATRLGFPSEDIYAMITDSAARLLDLKQHEGSISEGGVADLIAVKDTGDPPAQRLRQLSHADIEWVILKGQVTLVSPCLASQLLRLVSSQMQKVLYHTTERFVAADVSRHWYESTRLLGQGFRLAGREMKLMS